MVRTFTKEEIDKILENHKHWFLEDCEGWRNMRADLQGADLRGVDLSSTNLSGANLRGADLSGTKLLETRLVSTNLYGTNLRGADLRGANLYGANLFHADLQVADFHSAVLYDANLCKANLFRADLRDTNLRNADIRGADLREVDIRGADLRGADLSGAKNVPFIPLVCPDVKAFTGWKKAFVFKDKTLGVPFDAIIELEIPTDARRSSATSRKCRCDKAVVKSITSVDGSESFDTAFSKYDYTFVYKVGETVCVDNFEEDRFRECAPGIHFFINRQEAVDYCY